MADQPKNRSVWLKPLLVLGGAAVLWFFLLVALDVLLTLNGGVSVSTLLAGYSNEEVVNVLGNLPEVALAILGIAITMVSFILQLAATRYTPRVTDMFFRDRTNMVIMGFFVVASVHCVWATMMLRRSYIPHVMVLATLAMITVAILILIPYVAYVFAFLDPTRVVSRLQEQSLAEAVGKGGAASIAGRQERVLEGVEQLADVAVNSVSQKDRIVASRSVDALRDLVLSYLSRREELSASWFTIGPLLRRNPDFVSMAPASVEELSQSGTWVEWKILRQYQTIYNESLNRMRDISQLVAIDTRYIGERAVTTDQHQVLTLAVKFFNTYLRATINLRDVRTAYNVLHQYRLLAEEVLRQGWGTQALEIARHFKYYGQLANQVGLPFVTETAAYDLCTLCELAHERRCELERELLGVFLEVDKVPENEAQEQSLRGVRKAQVKLASYYLMRGEEELARLVFTDMEHERPERLRSIRDEMLAVKDKDFWEVIDRGHNFDYLDDAQRQQLQVFYSWFTHLD